MNFHDKRLLSVKQPDEVCLDEWHSFFLMEFSLSISSPSASNEILHV